MKIQYLIAIAVIIAACGCKGRSASPPNGGTFSDKVAEVEKTLTRGEPPVDAPLLRWSFDRTSDLQYDYQQESVFEIKGGTQSSKATGTLVISPKPDRTATLEVRELSMTMNINGQTQTIAGPEQTLPTLNEDGTAPAGEQNWPLQLIAALPGRALGVGESQTMPFEVPITGNVGGGQSAVGTLDVRVEGYAVVDGHTCAELKMALTIPRKPFGEAPNTGSFSMSAVGLVLFDYERGELAASYLAATLMLETRPGGASEAMTQHHFISVTR